MLGPHAICLGALLLSALAPGQELEPVPAFDGLAEAAEEAGVTWPTALGPWPGRPGHLFLAERGGRVLELAVASGAGVRTVLDLDVGRVHPDEGLHAIAFHPDFERNGRLFVHHSLPKARRARIAEWRLGEGGRLDPRSERIVLEVAQPWRNANGGGLAFGPDGRLYVGLGDGGSENDPQRNAQDPNSWLGKVLRLDVDHASGRRRYGVPDDNPFVELEEGARGEVWALGLHDPRRLAFDAATGLLWCVDAGYERFEEVHAFGAGDNLGWPLREGLEDLVSGADLGPGELTQPVAVLPHARAAQLVGGVVYRGARVPSLRDHYVFADGVTGRVWALPVGATASEPVPAGARAREVARLERPTALGFDEAGELLFTERSGRILRLR